MINPEDINQFHHEPIEDIAKLRSNFSISPKTKKLSQSIFIKKFQNSDAWNSNQIK